MNEKFTIVKVSGKIVEKADELRTFVKAFSAIKGKKMLIFSGNMMAQEIGNKLGIKTKLIDERPVVNAGTLKLLTMVYGGFSCSSLSSDAIWLYNTREMPPSTRYPDP